MSANTWAERHPADDLEPLNAILYGDEGDEDEEISYRGYDGRRRKAAAILILLWGGIIALNSVTWGSWAVLGLSLPVGVRLVRLLFATPVAPPDPQVLETAEELPFVSLVVAAKNEETTIARVVKLLCDLDYPRSHYEVCVVNDASTDSTPKILDNLARQHDNLTILHRQPGAGGGKSGALNAALKVTRGDIIAVFDADASVDRDLLRRVLPTFTRPEVGAVQIRKTISNAEENFWTRGQAAEMAMDLYIQQQRVAAGGVGELRGNGQFVRRLALDRCGGFNEETITDDLDLSFRLHLDRWQIEMLASPPVFEEGVTDFVSLWHQRSRWAEGGYQRYLDYWRLFASNRMGLRKSWDALTFFAIQYLMPATAVPELAVALVRRQLPLFSPVVFLTLAMTFAYMVGGIWRSRRYEAKRSIWEMFQQSVLGMVYFMHWFVVIVATTARIAVLPKRLKWVKTVHRGDGCNASTNGAD